MPSPRLIAIVTALMFLTGGNAANAAYTLEQLRQIDDLISSKDCAALWNYLIDNPELLQGDDPLAVELRQFVIEVEKGLISCLGAKLRRGERVFLPIIGQIY